MAVSWSPPQNVVVIIKCCLGLIRLWPKQIEYISSPLLFHHSAPAFKLVLCYSLIEINSAHLCTTANQYYLQLIIYGLYSFLKGWWDCAHLTISLMDLVCMLVRWWPILRLLAFPPDIGTVYCLQVGNKSVFHGNQSTMVVSSCSPSPNWPLWPPANQFHSSVSALWLDGGYKIRSCLYCWA